MRMLRHLAAQFAEHFLAVCSQLALYLDRTLPVPLLQLVFPRFAGVGVAGRRGVVRWGVRLRWVVCA